MPACRSVHKGILRTKKALHGPVPHPKPQALPFLFLKGVPDMGIETGGRRGVDGGRGAGKKAEHEKGCMPRAAGALQARGEWEGKTEPEPGNLGPLGGSRARAGGCCSGSCSHFLTGQKTWKSQEKSLPFIFPRRWKGVSVLGCGVRG